MTRRTAIIHVGHEKTGSTAVQDWLATQRAALLGEGILVPSAIGSPHPSRLVAACLDDGVVDNIRAQNRARRALSDAELRHDIARRLAADTATPGWRRLVISSELITSRLHTPSEIDRLVGMVSPHVDAIEFVIFLRRQDDLAVSRFSSALRAGHAGYDDVFADLSTNSFLTLPEGRDTDDMREFYDYERILARFRRVPGARLRVLPYHPPDGPAQPVARFARVLDLAVPDAVGSRRLNPAMSADAQYVLSRLNARFPLRRPDGSRDEAVRAVQRRVEAEVGGARRTVPRRCAEAFLARFAAGNARVEAEHAPGQRLFREGFSSYPETLDDDDMTTRLEPVVAAYAALLAPAPAPTPAARPRLLGRLDALWRQRVTR